MCVWYTQTDKYVVFQLFLFYKLIIHAGSNATISGPGCKQ